MKIEAWDPIFTSNFVKLCFPERDFLEISIRFNFLIRPIFFENRLSNQKPKMFGHEFFILPFFFFSGRNKIEPNKKFRNVFRIPVVPVKALQVLPLKCLLRTFEARALLVTLMKMQDWLVLMLCLRTY